MPTKKWNFAKSVKSLQEWVADEYNHQSLFLEPQRELQRYVTNSTPSVPLSDVGLWLRDISTWYLNKGCSDIGANHPDGLHDLQLGARYAGWGRIAASTHLAGVTPKPSPRLLLNDECLNLATLLALGLSEDSQQLGLKIISGLELGLYIPDQTGRVSDFVLRLFCAWKKVPFPEKTMAGFAPAADVYQQLLSSLWRDPPEALKPKLHATCDFHVARSKPSTDRETFEFDQDAFGIFPAEILAALRAREEQGLPLPLLDHPIMATPLGRLPSSKQPPQDPLLESVIAKLRTVGRLS